MSAQASNVKYEEPASPTNLKIDSAANLDEESAIQDEESASPVDAHPHRTRGFSMNDPLPLNMKTEYGKNDQSFKPTKENEKRRGSESWNRTVQPDSGSRLFMARRFD